MKAAFKTVLVLALVGIAVVVGFILGLNSSIPLKTGLDLTGHEDVIPLIEKIVGQDRMATMDMNTSGPYCIIHGGGNIAVADTRSKLIWFSLTDVEEGETPLLGLYDAPSESSIHLLDRDGDSLVDALAFARQQIRVVDTNLDGTWDFEKHPTSESTVFAAGAPKP